MVQSSSSSPEKRIRVLETLLQRTFAAHPHLKHWAFHEDGISRAESNALSSLSGPGLEAVSDESREVASLKHNRDKWRARAYKLKDMCKQLQLRVQQDTMSTWKSPDSFVDQTANLLPAADIGILHTVTQPVSQQELQEAKGELPTTAPATSGRQQVSTISDDDTVPIMTLPGLRIRTSTDGQAGPKPPKATSFQGTMKFPPAMNDSSTTVTPGPGKTAYKSALKKGMTTRKKGVSLHESQNITHEFEDCVPKEERVPSIMDMLQAGGTKSDASAVQKPSLMEVLQEQEQQQAQQKAHQGTRKLERSASEKALPCMLSVKTSLDADGNQQLSLSIDDATKDVLTGLLKMANTDELKSTPPLDFFAAAGLLDSFTYTPTDPKTPAYFKVNKASLDSDEPSNPFTRTGRIAIPQEDHVDEAAQNRATPMTAGYANAGYANDSVAPVAVVGFACYDDSPKAAGSAMEMIQQGLSDSDSDAADRIFGAPPPVVEQNSDDEKIDMLDRIFGGSAAAQPADDTADTPSPSVKDRVHSFEEMFRGGESRAGLRAGEDELEDARALLASRIFGDVLPADDTDHGGVDDEVDNARAALTTRIFGGAEPSATAAEAGGGAGRDMQFDRLANRGFGDQIATDSAGGEHENSKAVDDDDRARNDLTARLFGTNVDSGDAENDGDVAHQANLEERIFGINTLVQVVGGKGASSNGAGPSMAAGVSKWQQHENTAALHSTRIRAGPWLADSDGGSGGVAQDSSDLFSHLQGQAGDANRLQLPGGHAGLDMAPCGF